ncbi:Golgi matrix protein, putative [Paecilomyces variotii No. 5]|uniref:Golgi matrix protein, putative n=1 Tax=Byssochlamys spectabilis (strain No. 5 / NBRC 109023) TaxID=1356009 RepID=V5G0U0_BYSSN|nr:Golgi matrix protein, putative [Paecilomyces variotii No. 5]
MPAGAPSAVGQGTKPKNKKNKKSAARNKAKNTQANDGTQLENESEQLNSGAADKDGDSVKESEAETAEEQEEEDGDGDDGTNDVDLPVRTNKSDSQANKDGVANNSSTSTPLESEDRFNALVRERDSLREEVTRMRKSLEEIQSKHRDENQDLQQKLEESEGKKERAETQYQKLLERVNTIKSQLGERLKEDAEEIAQARSRIEELEDHNSNLKAELDAKASELSVMAEEAEQQSKELSTLRDRTSLSQQNWLKEKEELLEQEAYVRTEFEEAKQAMHNWEVLAMEERSIRENLEGKVIDIEEQLSALREAYDKAVSERDSQTVTVDGLQRALQEIQTARKTELRELVESSDAQLEELRQSVRDAEKRESEAKEALQHAQKELERLLPFEKEVKEKNLLIGKLRHEAVTLNDHLTKALRFLKRGKPEDNVDRHIVTNHLLHFLALDRSDPKKFQILQLIAALLGWTDEQREQAGLARPGTSTASSRLRIPSTTIHRNPSTPSLVTEFMDSGNASRESLAELWSNFLEQEAQTGAENQQKPGAAQSSPKK